MGRGLAALLTLLVVWGHLVTAADDINCGESKRIVFQSPGNVTLTGIFNVHKGEECNEYVTSGLEHAAAAISAVQLLNLQNYLPGYQIGLTIFDGCQDGDEAQKSFVQSLVLENCQKPNSTSLGIFTTNDIMKTVEPLATGLNKSITALSSALDRASLVSMVTQLLKVMAVNTVNRIVADTQNILSDIGRKLADEGICVYDQVLTSDQHAINNEILSPPQGAESEMVSKASPVIIVITSADKVEQHFGSLSEDIKRMAEITWIVATTDGIFDTDKDLLPNKTLVLSALMPKVEDLEKILNLPEVSQDPLNHRQATKSPIFLTTISAVINLLEPLKKSYEKCYISNETCSQVTEFLDDLATEKIALQSKRKAFLEKGDIGKVYQALSMEPDEESTLFSVLKSRGTDDIALFQLFDMTTFEIMPKLLIFKERRRRSIVRVSIEDIERRGEEHPPPTTSTTTSTTTTTTEKIITEITTKRSSVGMEKHPCHAALGNLPSICGICLNFVKYLSRVAQEKQTVIEEVAVGWRFETWVTINASVVAMGSLCAIAIFIFVVARLCLGDVLEGSPALSFFLLIAVLITYAATLPFSFQTTGNTGDWTLSAVVCDLRVAGPALSYSILFSIMFSRSLMLAASDQDGGFMSHVNGYLQAVSIFFTCAVQFAISGEFWLYNSFLMSPTPVLSCQEMYESSKFMFLLAYDVFLLVLMVAVIPFMMRSKRNYKEGMFFSIAIVAIFALWAAWIPLLYLLPDYQDAAVILGLTGTPTAIVLCIFIPRTYLMTTAIVRDRIVNTLPPLVHTEHQFRSTQALYDTLNLAAKSGGPNPNFYSVNPLDSGPGTPQIQPGQYYAAEGIKPNTPKKLQLISKNNRADTPENPYQAFDSPVHSPSRVTRF